MKKIISSAILAVVGIALTGCDNLLDDNRYPETSLVNNPEYWSNPDNCELQCNRFYKYFYGYGNGTGTGNFYFNTLTDDQCGNGFTDWKFTNVPNNSSTYNTLYEVIRGCNIIIQEVGKSSLTEAQKNNFIGQARLIRGYEYYNLVRYYGDVILVESVLDTDSETLYAPRTDRKTVMDYAYEDLKFASENIALNSGNQKFTKDLAKAMLSDLCLYEGTFWKYCTLEDNYYAPDKTRSDMFLQRCVEYSTPLVVQYPISSDYAALYNSVWIANPQAGLTGLSDNPEIIFACEYEKDVFMHSTIDYTSSSTMLRGISKDAFDAYLFKDGKPKALTSENTTDAGTPVAAGEFEGYDGPGLVIENLLAVRDRRLAATIDPAIFYKDMTWQRAGAMMMTSSSGYGVCKYDNVRLPVDYRDQGGKNYTSCPLYWGSVVALNLAEAKTELGTLTDADMDVTLNRLYARAGLPAQTVASLSSMNDPANNMGVSSLLWEVRRCRRCELIMDNDFRYWDLVRWHKLELLDNTKHPDVLLGANVSNAPVAAESVTGNYINATFGHNRVYDNRQYEWPLPQDQLTLNKNLKQQPLWATATE